jgi:Asp-tRNA(Asn)/Glu-tRNA(Gln) amidotransferase A subunit family amidase
MATSLATTEYFMESLLKSDPWNIDPGAIPIPWRKELAAPPTNRKLILGVVFDDGVVKPQPPVARAMRETVDALRAAGHDGIPIILPYSIYSNKLHANPSPSNRMGHNAPRLRHESMDERHSR